MALTRSLWVTVVSSGCIENIFGSWNFQVLHLKDALNSKTSGRSLNEKKRIGSKGKYDFFSHSIFCSTLGWRRGILSMSQFYQCWTVTDSDKRQLVGRRQKSSCRVDEDRRLEDECPSSPADTKWSKCGDDKEIDSREYTCTNYPGTEYRLQSLKMASTLPHSLLCSSVFVPCLIYWWDCFSTFYRWLGRSEELSSWYKNMKQRSFTQTNLLSCPFLGNWKETQQERPRHILVLRAQIT